MADVEKARREIRYARSAADDRRWDLLESRLQQIDAALEGAADVEREPVLAELLPLRQALQAGVRAEQAGRIERELQRLVAWVTDDLQRGGTAENQLQKLADRLAAADTQGCLDAPVIERFAAECRALQAKAVGDAAAPPASAPVPTEIPTPAPTAASTAEASPPAPAAATGATPPAGADPERARALEGELQRILRFAADDLASRPDLSAAKLESFAVRVGADEALRHLAPATVARLQAAARALREQVEAAEQAERVRALEEQVARFLRQADSDRSWNPRGANDMLARAAERLAADDTQALPAATREQLQAELQRLTREFAGADRKAALERAAPLLQELEARVAGPLFDGSSPDYQVVAELEALGHRVRAAIEGLAADDDERGGIEARLDAVTAKIAAQSGDRDRDAAIDRIAQLWQLECEAIDGWQQEPGEATYELPRTALAVRRLTRFLGDDTLDQTAREHAGDHRLRALLDAARSVHVAALARLDRSFDAVLAGLEQRPRPSNRFDLELPARLAANARGDFEGTPSCDAHVARATALDRRWQAEIEADRRERQARYDELSARALEVWRGLLPGLDAATSFDPGDPRAAGTTVLLRGIRNRIGWDFGGPVEFAMWVGSTPVVGNFAPHVAAAVREAVERTGLAIDDHTDWDVVLVIGAPGQIKQRFQVEVRDHRGLQIGTVEEWRPVPCLGCTVIGLCAGPVAVAPAR